MPIGRTGCKGTAGPSPNPGFWFAPIPDKFSLLKAMGGKVDNQLPVHNVNQWHIYNEAVDSSYIGGTNAPTVALGVMGTAPDGTNTAQKIVETSTTTSLQFHQMIANALPNSTRMPGGFVLRLAVFAKAAERQRIQLRLGVFPDGNSGSSSLNQCTTTYDLFNGVIAIPNTALNQTGTISVQPGQAAMIPFGSGWYCCQMDMIVPYAGVFNVPGQMNFNDLWAGMSLDAGVGNAASNISYAGVTGNGVYTWKSTCMFPQAWAMPGKQVFFDDFTSLSTVDTTNTQGTNFKWWVNNRWAQIGWRQTDGVIPTSSGAFSAASSVLKINPTNQNQAVSMMSALYSGSIGGAVVGQSWTPPFLFEMNFATQANSDWGLSAVTNQMLGLKLLNNYNASLGVNNPQGLRLEVMQGNIAQTQFQGTAIRLFYPFNQVEGSEGFAGWALTNGYPPWYSPEGYSLAQNDRVLDTADGNFYAAGLSTTPGTPPHSDLAHWTLLDVTNAGQVNPPYAAKAVCPSTDYTAQQTYSMLVLPPTSYSSCGLVLTFINGMPANRTPPINSGGAFGISSNFGPWVPGWEVDSYVISLYPGNNNSFGKWDWVSVTQ